jgi:hypothetical protein
MLPTPLINSSSLLLQEPATHCSPQVAQLKHTTLCNWLIVREKREQRVPSVAIKQSLKQTF